MNLEAAGMGSPRVKRRSVHGTLAFGNDFNVFEQTQDGAASEARWKLLKAEPYGYDALVDYQDPDWPEQIRGFTGGIGIHYAFDCISEASSVERTCSTLARDGKIAIVRSREGGAR